jgi:hypothetical protein
VYGTNDILSVAPSFQHVGRVGGEVVTRHLAIRSGGLRFAPIRPTKLNPDYAAMVVDLRVARMREATCGDKSAQGPGCRFAYPGYACYTKNGLVRRSYGAGWRRSRNPPSCHTQRRITLRSNPPYEAPDEVQRLSGAFETLGCINEQSA